MARGLSLTEGCELAYCCDADSLRLKDARRRYPEAGATESLDDLLAADIDAVAVATPVSTHNVIATRALEAGKDCFVEKPLAQSVPDAQRLASLAENGGRVLMAGHLLEYHPGVVALGELIESGELGEVHYIYSQRLNLGKLRADENALWSLGAHDVSALLALTGELPVEVVANGESFVRSGVEDVVFGLLRFPSGPVAHLHLSWLDPHKERRLTVVGSKRMATFDDMAPERKLTVFDKGFDPDGGSPDDYVVRSGQPQSPAIDREEPLRIELAHFVECVRQRREPRTDGASGVRVVRVLEALQASLDANGEAVEIAGSVL